MAYKWSSRNISIACTSFLWKMPAARAADAFVFVNTSVKCSTAPAPLLAITGMLTASEINFIRSISNPFPWPVKKFNHETINYFKNEPSTRWMLQLKLPSRGRQRTSLVCQTSKKFALVTKSLQRKNFVKKLDWYTV